LLYDVDASHGTIRIPWFANGNQKSDSKPDSKERKLLILLGILRKLAFYQLNYSRSTIRFKYRRIIGFTATANFVSLGIQILPLALTPFGFAQDRPQSARLQSENGQQETALSSGSPAPQTRLAR
jgi:hypothetical protein